jgi:hypothetical protein
MRTRTVVVIVALAHSALSVGLFMLVSGAGMARFDTGAPSSNAEWVLEIIVAILHAPVATLAFESVPIGWLPGLWGYLPLLLNSLIWALVLVWIARLLGRFRSPRRVVDPRAGD